MSNEAAPLSEFDGPGAATNTTTESTAQSWICRLVVVVCIGIFIGLAAENDYESWQTVSKFGYLPAQSIWDGGYWALLTSAFVHFALWHVAFNVYWLWVLGSRLERAIGSLPFLAFFIVSAFVSSSFQLVVSDSTGVGASGVVYAIFGFMWPTRHQYSQFNDVLDARTIQIFVIWLVGCVVATYLKVWEVGNAAHISGLLFGGAAAGAFVLRFKPRLMFAGVVALVIVSVIPLFWCPWSVTWLSLKAYDAHAAGQFEVARSRYTQIIHIDPRNAWAYLNRSYVYQVLGEPEKALTDFQRAQDIDPSIEEAPFPSVEETVPTSKPDEATSAALIVLDGADEIRRDPGAYGSFGVAYGISEEYPASNAIEQVSSRLESLGWKPLKDDWLNAGNPSSHVDGWSDFLDGTRTPTDRVHRWGAQWTDESGNLVDYTFTYSYPKSGPQDLQSLWISAAWYPVDGVRIMQSMIEAAKAE